MGALMILFFAAQHSDRPPPPPLQHSEAFIIWVPFALIAFGLALFKFAEWSVNRPPRNEWRKYGD